MSLAHTLGGLTVFWFILFFIDKFFRRYRPWKSSYLQRLEDLGISVSFAHIRCYTTKFNKLFHAIGNSSKALIQLWFGVGVVAGVVLMLASVTVLAYTLYQFVFFSRGDEASPQQVLTPVMPGVNLPWGNIVYYLLTLIVCGVFHEVGHALAASTEQVKVTGFGVFVLFLYPGAFVDLHSDHLSVISPKRQLRIYCAGVWHNAVLVLFALALMWCTPFLLSPFYTSGLGAVVVSLPQGSVLNGKLEPGNVITGVNSCPVTSEEDWYKCVEKIYSSQQGGYCVPEEMLTHRDGYSLNQTKRAKDGAIECCNEESLSDICFQLVFGGGRQVVYKCLTARSISARGVCTHVRDCRGVSEYTCAFPATPPHSKLVRISHTDGKDVLFLGDPSALPHIVSTSDLYPRSPLSPLWWPDMLRTLCTYIVSLSSALALLNMVPAYFLDGQWALTVLVELCFEKRIPDAKKRHVICTCVLVVGSVLLVLNVCLGVWTLINW